MDELWRSLPRFFWIFAANPLSNDGHHFALDEKVAVVPIHAVEAVLRSEKLQLKSENYTLTLALHWARPQKGTKDKRQQLFNRLLKSLRYARLSAFFLAAAIRMMPAVQDSGMVSDIVWRGLFAARRV